MVVTRATVSRWENDRERMDEPSDHLLQALVTSHQPTVNYAVDDLLRDLPDHLSGPNAKAVHAENASTGWKAETAGV
jgi:hypothetical protein